MREGNTVIKRDQKSLKVIGRKNGTIELGVKVPVNKGVDNVELLLTYEGIYLESDTLFTNRSFNRNPKMGIVSAIDSELTEYHQGIAGRKRKTGGGFEQAMMAPLNLSWAFPVYTLAMEVRIPISLHGGQIPQSCTCLNVL